MATAARKKPARLKKGSAAAKRHMAKVRAARRKNPATKRKAPARKKVAATRRKNPATKRKVAPKRKTAAKRGRPVLSRAKKAANARKTSYVKRASQATKRAPTKRLVQRRKTNTGVRTYPNPSPLMRGYYIALHRKGKVGWFDGVNAFDTSKAKATVFRSQSNAKAAARELAKKANGDIFVVPEGANATAANVKKAALGYANTWGYK